MEPFVFEWKMPVAKYTQCKVKERLWSASYSTPQYLPLKFYLRLFPHGDADENADQISYFLFCEPPNGQTVTLKYNLYILNEDGKRIAESPWTGEFGTKHQTWGKRRFCNRPNVSADAAGKFLTFGCKVEVENFDPEIFKQKPSVPDEEDASDSEVAETTTEEETKKSPNLYPTLSVEAVTVREVVAEKAEAVPTKSVTDVDSTLAEIDDDEWSDSEEKDESDSSEGDTKVLSKLGGKIAQLYENMEISDVSLCVDGEEIPAHKLILFLHSPCLAAMIKQDDWETAATKIDIEGFAALTVQKALEFMYTETIANVHELQVAQMMELSRFATMFSISDLKEFINHQIISSVNTSTACQLANLSMTYNEDAIHATALEFITKNLQAIKLDESFEKLSGENAKAILRML